MKDDLQLGKLKENCVKKFDKVAERRPRYMYRFVSATHVLLNSSLDMSVYLINEYIYI